MAEFQLLHEGYLSGADDDITGSTMSFVRDDNGEGRDEEITDLPIWSPDGSRIGFSMFTAEGQEPYVMDEDGTEPVRLRGEGVVLGWTPDGSRIMLNADQRFVSVRPDGSGERLFVEEPPELGRLVIDWSPDGEWIAMSSPASVEPSGRLYLMRGDGSEIFMIGIATEPSWRPKT